ncbi:MAG: signal peptidase II [Kineosporiaceae bacterium]|nr:signal peptidase II [Kineosporiaceae bacterium]
MAGLPLVESRRGLPVLLIALAAVIVVLDQVTKVIAVDRLEPGVPVTVIEGWLQFRLVRNPGAAFSLGTGTTWVFTIIAVVVGVVILRTLRRVRSLPWAIALGLLLGGLLGNLTDRLFRQPGVARGHVVDFVEYLRFPLIDFPVFNVADSCITTSAILIALLGVLNIPMEGRPGDQPAETSTDRSGEASIDQGAHEPSQVPRESRSDPAGEGTPSDG